MGVNVKKCMNGHFFDADKYEKCPHCGAAIVDASFSQDNGTTTRQKEKAKSNAEIIHMPEKLQDNTIGVVVNRNELEKEVKPSKKISSFLGTLKPNKAMCPHCGGTIDHDDSSFCTHCGKPIKPTNGQSVQSVSDSNITTPGVGQAPVSSMQNIQQQPPVVQPQPTQAPLTNTDNRTNNETIIPQNSTNEQQKPSKSLEEAVSNSGGKTVGYFGGLKSQENQQQQINKEPIAGWLVCIKGKNMGTSFSILCGRNSIGRNTSNTIAIPEDETVSRDKHFWITFDPKNKDFFVGPGEGNGLIYLNNETVLGIMKLNPKDILEVGAGKYIFIPLCGEDFSWEQYFE